MSQFADHPKFDRRYVVQNIAGSGGMGVVYQAFDTVSKDLVAIKTLVDSSLNSEFCLRLKREARVLERLKHPNLVRFIAAELDSEPRYLVLEYISGQTLGEATLKATSRDAKYQTQVLTWLLQLANALKCCHESGIIHRDVKPDNVMIDNDSKQAILIDFGLTKVEKVKQLMSIAATLTETNDLIGTMHFMAPEQLDSRIGAVGPHSDVWAFGATAYFALCGQTPFQGESNAALYGVRLTQSPRPIAAGVTVSRSIEKILFQCMEQAPEKRPDLVDVISVIEKELGPSDSVSHKFNSAVTAIQTRSRLLLWCGLVAVIAACIGALVLLNHNNQRLDAIIRGIDSLERRVDTSKPLQSATIERLEARTREFASSFQLLKRTESIAQANARIQLLKTEYAIRAGNEDTIRTEIEKTDSVLDLVGRSRRPRAKLLMAIYQLHNNHNKALEAISLVMKAEPELRRLAYVRRGLILAQVRNARWREALSLIEDKKSQSGEMNRIKLRCLIGLKKTADVIEMLGKHPEYCREFPELLAIAIQSAPPSFSARKFHEALIWCRIVKLHGNVDQVQAVIEKIDRYVARECSDQSLQRVRETLFVIQYGLRVFSLFGVSPSADSRSKLLYYLGLHAANRTQNQTRADVIVGVIPLLLKSIPNRVEVYLTACAILRGVTGQIRREKFLTLANEILQATLRFEREMWFFEAINEFLMTIVEWSACGEIEVPILRNFTNNQTGSTSLAFYKKNICIYYIRRHHQNKLRSLSFLQEKKPAERIEFVRDAIRESLTPTTRIEPVSYYAMIAAFLYDTAEDSDSRTRMKSIEFLFDGVREKSAKFEPLIAGVFKWLIYKGSDKIFEGFVANWTSLRGRCQAVESDELRLADAIVELLRHWISSDFAAVKKAISHLDQVLNAKSLDDKSFIKTLQRCVSDQRELTHPGTLSALLSAHAAIYSGIH